MILERFLMDDWGTFGRLLLDNGKEVFTVEPPWENNDPMVSCIPEGTYPASRGTFQNRYEDLELHNVPGRSKVEMHGANWAHQLKGCIAPGMEIGWLDGERCVLRSQTALRNVLLSFRGPYTTILIRRVIPLPRMETP